MDIKYIAVAGVVVERRSELEVKDVRKIKPRAYLPREQERIVVRDLLASLTSPASG